MPLASTIQESTLVSRAHYPSAELAILTLVFVLPAHRHSQRLLTRLERSNHVDASPDSTLTAMVNAKPVPKIVQPAQTELDSAQRVAWASQ